MSVEINGVRMYSAEEFEDAARAALIWKQRAEDLEEAIEEYVLWRPGRRGHAAAHRRLIEAMIGAQTDEDAQ